MAQNLFKTRYLPNPDGTESTTALTNSNTAFVHTVLGDDYTGDGTREKPFQSMNKAATLGKRILFRGNINEYFNFGNNSIIGDDKNQVLIYSQYSPRFAYLCIATIDIIPTANPASSSLDQTIVLQKSSVYQLYYRFSLIKKEGITSGNYRNNIENSTFNGYIQNNIISFKQYYSINALFLYSFGFYTDNYLNKY